MARKKITKLEEPDVSALDDAEVKAAKARAKAEYDKERKGKQLEELVAFEKQELERKEDPNEEEVFVRVILPEFCERIWIDGTIYLHGWAGYVPMSRFMSMQDIMARSWEHKFDTEGKKLPNKRPPLHPFLNANDAGANAQQLLRRHI